MRELRERMCQIGRRAYRRQLVAATEGNFSCRLDGGRVLCTPTGLCKGLLSPADLCVIDADGNQIDGARRPSSEMRVHLEVYHSDPAAGAVIHTHPPFATTFAVLGEAVPPAILPESELFLGAVPLVPYETTGTVALADALRPFIAGHSAVLLQNHGALSWGASLESAYDLTEMLEAVCRVIHQARQIGQPRSIPAGKLAELRARRSRSGNP
ncbi:L-ribulose-5-phosphate 4-epimerase UlaF [Phycisphaerae bacterium RAS1]|nr:L-ribulose-5-phosphate 4-epimerase UlaF [Phycisphaerae bacterium RAS1]